MALMENFDGGSQHTGLLSSNPFDSYGHDDNLEIVPLSLRPESTQPTETPMLKKETFKYNARLNNLITHMVVSGDSMTIVENGKEIKRFSVSRQIQYEKVDFQEDIHTLFQDPTGQHLLLCTNQGQDTYYYTQGMKRPRAVPRSKGNLIEAVGWNSLLQTDTTTGPILLGSSKGIIFETEFDVSDQSFLTKLRPIEHFNKLFQLSADIAGQNVEAEPVTGLALIPQKSGHDIKYFVIVTTSSHLFQFSGLSSSSSLLIEPVFQPIFAPYKGKSGNLPEMIEVPGNADSGAMAIWPTDVPKTADLKHFAWLTGNGIYICQFDFSVNKFLVKPDLIPYSSGRGGNVVVPLGVGLTEFHIIILYKDRLELVCVVNKEMVYQEKIPGENLSQMCLMALHPLRGEILISRGDLIWTYKIEDERRYLWKIFLELGNFERAKDNCRGNQKKRDIIERKHAESVFHNKKYKEAARLFAHSTTPFEEVALLFLEAKQIEALKSYLQLKLAKLSDEDMAQQTMLITWLVEIFLNSLGTLKESGNEKEFKETIQEFRYFLNVDTFRKSLDGNKSTLYELITSHGFPEETVHLAKILNDHGRVVRHYIQTDNYLKALESLRSMKKGVSDLYYTYSPILMRHVPKETVNAWISRKNKLDPVKLIAALVPYNLSGKALQEHNNEAIRYLEFCVSSLNLRDKAIHNFLISLYIATEDNAKLLSYLERQGEDINYIDYDVEYALRQCMQHRLYEACVQIYCVKCLFEEAMDLALKDSNYELARVVAAKPEVKFQFDTSREALLELKRKLWLMIAKDVVIRSKDIKQAMQILMESQVLKLEDILPFVEDFTKIETFKDAICSSLDEYNQGIKKLEGEMKTAEESADVLRDDIYNIRSKWSEVPAEMKCSICTYPLLIRGFYLFPCQHAFHSDCLSADIQMHLNDHDRLRLEELIRQHNIQLGEMGGAGGMSKEQKRLKSQIDDIVASDCPLCGLVVINEIDKTFFPKEDLETELEKWK